MSYTSLIKHPPITKNVLSLKQIRKIFYHLSKDGKMRGDLLLNFEYCGVGILKSSVQILIFDVQAFIIDPIICQLYYESGSLFTN